MNKARWAAIAAVGIVIGLTSCSFTVTVAGTGSVAKQEYPSVSGFSRVALTGIGEVKLSQGDTSSVTVRANENLLPYITIEVTNNELIIGEKPFTNILSYQTLEFDVTVPKLDSLELSGVGSAQTTQPLSIGTSSINLSGAGSANLDLICTGPLDVMISGTGGLTIAGSAPSITAGLSGVGSMNAKNMTATNASVSISGVGGAELAVTQALVYNLSGIGALTYWGNPASVSGQATGIGSVAAGS